MTPFAASLVALGGAYLFTSVYWGALASLRPEQREHRTLAWFCATLAGASMASALTWEARSPAEAAPAQLCQIVMGLPAMAVFTEHVLRIASLPLGIARVQRWLAGLGVAMAIAGLFYDPAFADPAHVVGGAGRPLAALRPAGLIVLLPMTALGFTALLRLFKAARGRGELYVPAVACGLSAIAFSFDVAGRALRWDTGWQLGAFGATSSVIGFTYIAVGRITRVDAELAHRTEELARSHDDLRTTQEELVRKEQLAAVGELSAVIAHEVRNPLAIIKNAVSGLRRDTLKPDDAETLLEILDEETDRLDRLVDDLLAYAKPISPERGPVDLRQLVAHAVELAASGYSDIADIEIELDLPEAMPEVDGDEALLRHALINIVDNALQAMPSGGTLTVSLRDATIEGAPCVAVDVHDTGEGMDTKVRSRARDPFFTTREQGTGLGLAIVERVARAHGGRIELDSRHGQGTTVSLLVPRDRISRISSMPP